MLNYIYKLFIKKYQFNKDNAAIYNYNKGIKEKINKIVIMICAITNLLLITEIISLL